MLLDGAALARSMVDPPADPRGLLLAFYPDADIAMLCAVDAVARPLRATINRGIWIVACECRAPGDPAPGMLCWLDVPLMWCVRCRNADAGHRWRPYLLPSPDERAAIDAVLEPRAIVNRNWLPGETVADLLRENAAHGLGREV